MDNITMATKTINEMCELSYLLENGLDRVLSDIVLCIKKTPKIDLNNVDLNGKTPLLLALENQNIKLLDVLLRNGANPNFYSDKTKVTPIGFAAYMGMYKEFKMLHKFGGDIVLKIEPHHVDNQGYWGLTLLHRIVNRMSWPSPQEMRGYKKIINFLIFKYENPLEKTNNGETVLDWSSQKILPYVQEQLALKNKMLLDETLTRSKASKKTIKL